MSATDLFLRRMLWREPGSTEVEPVVALLGPRGSGKSEALRAVSRACGGTVIHASLDFADSTLDPVTAVAVAAAKLSRSWTNLRHDPTFHRVGLYLLALNERLPDARAAAKRRINALIKEYLQHTPLGRAQDGVPKALSSITKVTTAVTGLARTPVGSVIQGANEQARPVIAALIGGASRLGIRRAMHWYRTVPDAEDSSTLDALIALSGAERGRAPQYLIAALLADIQEQVARHPEVRADCACQPPTDKSGKQHAHVRILLVDNAETANGSAFLAAMLTAKQQRVDDRDRPIGDPLLVVATANEWRPPWRQWWQEPWQTECAPGQQQIPLLSHAHRSLWTRHLAASEQALDRDRGWFPVWLDPLTVGQAAAMSPVASPEIDASALRHLVHRLSGGLPAAVAAIGDRIRVSDLPLSADLLPREILTHNDEPRTSPLWEAGAHLAAVGLPRKRPWASVPSVTALAAHLIQQGRSSDNPAAGADGSTSWPDVMQVLHLLRRNLWVSTFAARPSRIWQIGNEGRIPPAAMHPWLVTCLLTGLAAEDNVAPRTGGQGLWDALFSALSGNPNSGGPATELFCELARDHVDHVVAELVARFDTLPHIDWVRLLDDTTCAPCRFPTSESTQTTYDRLVPDAQPGRGAIEVAVAKLVTLLWLYRHPMTVPTTSWDDKIREAFDLLATRSNRENLNALTDAANRFRH